MLAPKNDEWSLHRGRRKSFIVVPGAMSKDASATPPKKDKEKKQKEKKKKEGFHLYSLFKKSKGFDRNVSAIPPIVREPIEWLYTHNGKYCGFPAPLLHLMATHLLLEFSR